MAAMELLIALVLDRFWFFRAAVPTGAVLLALYTLILLGVPMGKRRKQPGRIPPTKSPVPRGSGPDVGVGPGPQWPAIYLGPEATGAQIIGNVSIGQPLLHSEAADAHVEGNLTIGDNATVNFGPQASVHVAKVSAENTEEYGYRTVFLLTVTAAYALRQLVAVCRAPSVTRVLFVRRPDSPMAQANWGEGQTPDGAHGARIEPVPDRVDLWVLTDGPADLSAEDIQWDAR
jgi:hypothetical protein